MPLRRQQGNRAMPHLIILRGDSQRQLAKFLIDKAPADYVVRIGEPRRTGEQNDKMWAMLSDVSRSKPDGRMATPEVWKCLFMHALGHATRFEFGLDGQPFPIGFQSSRLSKREMMDLITFIQEYGDRHNVQWHDTVACV
jgi:hypothetical protein